MVTPRPLKLKSQVGALGRRNVVGDLPIARVWVDTGVFHLDSAFDYAVPEAIAGLIHTGTRVEVEFGSSLHEGIVLERLEISDVNGNLKQIVRALSPNPVATTETLELFRLVAKRWAGSPYEVIRSAIPPRTASVDKEILPPIVGSGLHKEVCAPAKELMDKHIRLFWALPASTSRQRLIAELVAARSTLGQVLLILPDERELNAMQEELMAFFESNDLARLDGHLSRSQRYRNFLRAMQGEPAVILGLRGAIFAPLSPGATIIVSGESSELLHEPRSPGWNARDVALIRASEFSTNLVLIGYSPSLEVARLIETRWLKHLASKFRREVIAIPQAQGELIPTGAFTLIRKALRTGPVLFLVPRKGYGNSVLCSKCRNVGLCKCGGRLELKGAGEKPHCTLCGAAYSDWMCKWCKGNEMYLVSRGIDRFAEEIGRAFPNFPVINSSGEHMVDVVTSAPALVISTPGAQPRNLQGYAGVALLEGLRFFGHSELRSTENSREIFFQTAAMAKESGTIFLALTPTHPIVHSLARWDATPWIRKELVEREEMYFPPYYRFISIESDMGEASKLHAGLVQARVEGRISLEVRIASPFEKSKALTRITLSVPVATAPALVDFVHELQRRRSISRKALLVIRVDPYSLT